MSLLGDVASQECFFSMELIVLHVGLLGSRVIWFHKRCADVWRQVSPQDFFLNIIVSKFLLYFGISCLLCHVLQDQD
jgi:hypothetical protein